MLSVPGTGRGVPACNRLKGVVSARRKETGGLLIKMELGGLEEWRRAPRQWVCFGNVWWRRWWSYSAGLDFRIPSIFLPRSWR